jgi:hypothetical protein
MENQLTGRAGRRRETEPANHVVETGFQKTEQVFPGVPFFVGSHREHTAELPFQNTGHTPSFLLFPKALAVFRRFSGAPTRVLAGRNRGALLIDGAFGVATVALQKELHAFAPAQLAHWTCVSSHKTSVINF